MGDPVCSPREGKAARDHALCPLGSASLEWTVCCAVCVCVSGSRDRPDTLPVSSACSQSVPHKEGDLLAAC